MFSGLQLGDREGFCQGVTLSASRKIPLSKVRAEDVVCARTWDSLWGDVNMVCARSTQNPIYLYNETAGEAGKARKFEKAIDTLDGHMGSMKWLELHCEKLKKAIWQFQNALKASGEDFLCKGITLHLNLKSETSCLCETFWWYCSYNSMEDRHLYVYYAEDNHISVCKNMNK